MGQTSHNSIEDEEPEAEPPSNDLIPVNMTQQKISAMSKGPMALVKPEEQNNFPEIYNASTSSEDCSLISAQPFSVRNKSDVVSSRTILGLFKQKENYKENFDIKIIFYTFYCIPLFTKYVLSFRIRWQRSSSLQGLWRQGVRIPLWCPLM